MDKALSQSAVSAIDLQLPGMIQRCLAVKHVKVQEQRLSVLPVNLSLNKELVNLAVISIATSVIGTGLWLRSRGSSRMVQIILKGTYRDPKDKLIKTCNISKFNAGVILKADGGIFVTISDMNLSEKLRKVLKR